MKTEFIMQTANLLTIELQLGVEGSNIYYLKKFLEQFISIVADTGQGWKEPICHHFKITSV